MLHDETLCMLIINILFYRHAVEADCVDCVYSECFSLCGSYFSCLPQFPRQDSLVSQANLKYEPPSDPLLELISNKLNGNIHLWEGSPTELTVFLNSDLKPNMLTKKLNINASILLNKYNVKYEYSRSHDGRRIKLERQTV